MRENDMGDKYILSLDVGTTTIRSMVYNKRGVVLGTAATPVRYHQVAKSITSSISPLPVLVKFREILRLNVKIAFKHPIGYRMRGGRKFVQKLCGRTL